MLADIFPSTIDELVEDAKCRVTRVENALSGPPSDAVRQPIITRAFALLAKYPGAGLLYSTQYNYFRAFWPKATSHVLEKC